MEIINSSRAPKAVGPYSQAIVSNGLVFCTGQVPLSTGGDLIDGSLDEQVCQVLGNLRSVLEEAGSSMEKVIKTTVFVSDIRDLAKVNEVYEREFRGHNPARSTVAVSSMPLGATICIDAVAEL